MLDSGIGTCWEELDKEDMVKMSHPPADEAGRLLWCPLLSSPVHLAHANISLFSSWRWIPQRGAPALAVPLATSCWRWVPPGSG